MEEKGFYIPKRYIVTALGFLGIGNIYTMRISLSVAIVAMVNTTAEAFTNSTDFNVECPDLIPQTQDVKVGKAFGPKYNWSAQQQGLMLGVSFIGYLITQVPGGYLSEKYGAKWILGGAVLNAAIYTLLTPLILSWDVNAFIIARAIEGVVEGMTFPAMNMMLSHWSPKMERSRLSTIAFSGISFGTVIAMLVAGWLCSSNMLGGWSSVFYLFGTISCIWFVFWACLVHESPSVHPTISIQELQTIQENKEDTTQNRPKTPWRDIITSLPMWAVLVAQVGYSVGQLTLLAQLPTYLNTILHFDVKENGVLSALPFAAQAIVSWTASFIADHLRRSNTFSVTNIRKIFNTIGLIGPALCLLAITISGCRPYLIVFLITLAVGLVGCCYSGFNVIHIDMSPTFAGTMYAITNGFGGLCGFIGPAIVGALTNSEATIQNWNYVFYIMSGSFIAAAAFFLAFASAELQPWGTVNKELISVTKV